MASFSSKVFLISGMIVSIEGLFDYGVTYLSFDWFSEEVQDDDYNKIKTGCKKKTVPQLTGDFTQIE